MYSYLNALHAHAACIIEHMSTERLEKLHVCDENPHVILDIKENPKSNECMHTSSHVIIDIMIIHFRK